MRLFVSSARACAAQLCLAVATVLAGCAGAGPRAETPHAPLEPVAQPTRPSAPANKGVELGIDVLESDGFQKLRGKRIGLLTHPAAVNRFGVSTLDVIFRDKRNQLVALYAGEHGIYGTIAAGVKFDDHIDERTGLKVFSLYTGRGRKPTPEQLRGIDVLVIDLQDIGTRSYTFASSMRYAVEGCFENNKEVVVLDRPNPLGGLKVSGPITDPEWINFLAGFRMPYVHGLTIGELARWAWTEKGVLQIPEEVRKRGVIHVIQMRGWRRDMLWPQTGLRWVATSPNVPDFDAVLGYPMTGLGAQLVGFRHGIGTPHPFRILSHPNLSQAELLAELNRRPLPGLRFTPRTITLPPAPGARNPAPRTIAGVYLEVVDWRAARPVELNFHLMQIAAAHSPRNPFASASVENAELYNKHVGSTAWWNAITRDGGRIDLAKFLPQWEREAQEFQQRTRKYWMY